MEKIKIKAIYKNNANREGVPYLDSKTQRPYNMVAIYEDGSQKRKLYGRAYNEGETTEILKWSKGDEVEVETSCNAKGFWNFRLPKAKPDINSVEQLNRIEATLEEMKFTLQMIADK